METICENPEYITKTGDSSSGRKGYTEQPSFF